MVMRGEMRDRVRCSSDGGLSIRQYCFGIGAPAMICVRLCKRVPSPPARTSAHNDACGRSVAGWGTIDVIGISYELEVASAAQPPPSALQECPSQSPCLRSAYDVVWSALQNRRHRVPKLGSRAEPGQTRRRSGGLLDSESLDDRLERRPLH